MSIFSETDEDVAVAISMQFLAEKIFEPSLYGAVPQYSEILQVIIRSMGDYCSPIRGGNESILVIYELPVLMNMCRRIFDSCLVG